MRKDLKEHAIEENYYYDLLKSIPKYIPQGYNFKLKKRVVGIIRGNVNEYKEYKDFLDCKYFDSWKDAYIQLELSKVLCPNCKQSVTPDITEYEEGLETFEQGKLCPICEEYL